MELTPNETNYRGDGTHTVVIIQQTGFGEDLIEMLNWHAEAMKTRWQARNVVKQLNLLPDRRSLAFSYEPQTEVHYPYNHRSARIVVKGIEDIVNGFFLGAVLNDLYHSARFDAGANGCYVAAPEGQLIIPVRAGEADQARRIAMGFVAKYDAAYDIFASAKELAPTGEVENVKRTMALTGYTKTLDCAPLIKSYALDLMFAKMNPEQKKTTAQMAAAIFSGPAPA